MIAPRFRPWPTDAAGRLLPAAPVRGLTVYVQHGSHIACFDRWRIVACSRLRFTARCGARSETREAAEWGAWLDARAAEGTLTAHVPGCRISWCRGCDTAAIGRPAAAGVPNVRAPARPAPADARARRIAQARAGRDAPPHDHTVTVDPTWADPARCTCGADPAVPCAHIVGALARDPALRCQLLDLFL